MYVGVCECVTSWGGTGVCVVHPGPSADIPSHFLCGPWVLCNLPHYRSYTQLGGGTTQTNTHKTNGATVTQTWNNIKKHKLTVAV